MNSIVFYNCSSLKKWLEKITEKQAKNKIHYCVKKLLTTEKVVKILNEYQIVDLKFKEWLISNPVFNEYYFNS